MQERLVDGGKFFVERDDAFPPRLVGVFDQESDRRLRILCSTKTCTSRQSALRATGKGY